MRPATPTAFGQLSGVVDEVGSWQTFDRSADISGFDFHETFLA